MVEDDYGPWTTREPRFQGRPHGTAAAGRPRPKGGPRGTAAASTGTVSGPAAAATIGTLVAVPGIGTRRQGGPAQSWGSGGRRRVGRGVRRRSRLKTAELSEPAARAPAARATGTFRAGPRPRGGRPRHQPSPRSPPAAALRRPSRNTGRAEAGGLHAAPRRARVAGRVRGRLQPARAGAGGPAGRRGPVEPWWRSDSGQRGGHQTHDSDRTAERERGGDQAAPNGGRPRCRARRREPSLGPPWVGGDMRDGNRAERNKM